jgi:predicted hydrocarbon binding protein
MSVQPFISFKFSGKVLLSYLNELRSLVGEKSVVMVLRKANMLQDIGHNVSSRHEKIAGYEALMAINNTIEDIFGETARRTVIFNAAKMSFKSSFANTTVVSDTKKWMNEHPESPLRLRSSLETITYLMEATSDQHINLDESSSHYHVTVENCVACWGMQHQSWPVCFYNVGIIRGGLSYMFGKDDYPVQELSCISNGDPICEFIIRKFPFSENERGSGKTGFLSLPAHLR